MAGLLLLTTEVMIADAPKEEAHHGHGGGGMSDMGGMGMQRVTRSSFDEQASAGSCRDFLAYAWSRK